MSSSIKIHQISLDKDNWENVPPMVFKSFSAFSQNMGNIKKWADGSDVRVKKSVDDIEKLQERAAAVESILLSMQERVDSFEARIQSISDVGRQQALASAGSLQRLENCVSALFQHMGSMFGVELNFHGGALSGPADGADETADQSPAPEEAGSEGAEAEDKENDGGAETKEGDEEVKREEEMQEESQELQELPPGVEVMNSTGVDLEANLGNLEEAFSRWVEMQNTENARRQSMEAGIEELGSAAERTRERILTWREMLKESSHAIDSLGQSLAKTQAAVQQLYATQVQHHDVEAAVRRKGEELEEVHRETEKRVDQLNTSVDDHMERTEGLIAEFRQHTDDKIEDHSLQVSKMVEGHMNPLNAYLNTMHVKADVMRLDVDGLQAQMPKLAENIREVDKRLEECDQAQKQQTSNLASSVEKLSRSVVENFRKGEGHQEKLSKKLKELSTDLYERVEDNRTMIEGTSELLHAVKNEDLNGLARELLTLDQKVAKWVHAHPLPAKISEARLFSLEARIADEIDARLTFEGKVKSKLLTPRSGRSVSGNDHEDHMALPQLSQDSAGYVPGARRNR